MNSLCCNKAAYDRNGKWFCTQCQTACETDDYSLPPATEFCLHHIFDRGESRKVHIVESRSNVHLAYQCGSTLGGAFSFDKATRENFAANPCTECLEALEESNGD